MRPAPASRGSSPSLPRSRSPLATDCSGLPSNSVRLDTTHSSTRSYISSTSTPSFRNTSRCGLLLRRRIAVGGDVVDRVLTGLHPRRRSRPATSVCIGGIACGGRKPQELRDPVLVRRDPRRRPSLKARPNSFQNVAYFSGWFAARSSSRPSTRLTDAARISAHVRRVLQDLPRDVERQVVRVDDAAHEPQVGRHQLLGVVHDEHAADVQLDAVTVIAVPQVERRPLRDEEQLRVLVAAFDLRVAVGERRLEVVRDVLVELLVLLLGDLGLRPRPERRRLVDLLVLVGGDLRLGARVPLLLLHQDRDGDVVRVLAQDRRAAVSRRAARRRPGRRCRMTSVPRVVLATVSTV